MSDKHDWITLNRNGFSLHMDALFPEDFAMKDKHEHKTIYLQVEGERSLEGGVTWCEDKINDSDVEYIRKDLFDAQHKRLETLERIFGSATAEKTINKLRGENEAIYATMLEQVAKERKKVAKQKAKDAEKMREFFAPVVGETYVYERRDSLADLTSKAIEDQE